MARYKLACGYEFDIKAAPIDDSSADLLAFALDCKRAGNDMDAMQFGRKAVAAVLKACAPEAFKRATLADVVSLCQHVSEMLNAAWGGELVTDAGAESKNA